jgi:uncharacterized protein YgiM (DUF1202 family)
MAKFLAELGQTPYDQVDSNLKAKVLIGGQEVGETPYTDSNLQEGELLIGLLPLQESSISAKPWQGYVKLNPGTLTVINRNLEPTAQAASGEVITLEKGKGVTVISTPPEAEVEVDGVIAGRTPVTLSDLVAGDHQFILSKENFVKRSIRAKVVEGYNLILTVDLAIAEADLTKLPTIPISATAQVVVKSTPTGFLRVRSTASANGQEVGQVKPGDVLTMVEEIPNWYRVRLSDGKEGFISAAYASKKQ